ncbi:cold shock domain-containing protein membrane protein [Azotobacter chroococcum]|uniref:Putative cold-shock DNA-binding protein n=1 Tax=Azotobacter chroococcum TaxID=353 RepID=A0A4R1PTV0_9GAMM|nr:cold-shock protein [Azotobacter chroococcum]TBV99581.1 cold-shock protein [Azotobacter chroococcum]TCL31333.1 putative cold-shock DNA-binding protein [Azotobacter chroococcum]
MLKILHLATGSMALPLSLVPAFDSEALPFLQQANALYLNLFGLLNLLHTPGAERFPRPAQRLVSALLILSVAIQALILLMPLESGGGQPAVLFSLSCAAAGVLLHLGLNLGWRTAPQQEQFQSDGEDEPQWSDREVGTVKWFNSAKGFGFIARNTGEDVFVHFRAIRGEGHRVLVEGQRVEFSVIRRDRGLQAEDVIARPRPRR